MHKGPAILDGGVNVHATERYENGLMAISLSLHSNNLSHLFNTRSGLDNSEQCCDAALCSCLNSEILTQMNACLVRLAAIN